MFRSYPNVWAVPPERRGQQRREVGEPPPDLGIPTDGLVAQYAFDDGSGTVVSDSSGLGNDGVVASGTTWAWVATGLEAASNDVRVDTPQIPNGNAPFSCVDVMTFAAWLTSRRVWGQGIGGGSENTRRNPHLGMPNSTTFRFGTWWDDLDLAAGREVIAITNFMAATYDASTLGMALYVNASVGTLVTSDKTLGGTPDWSGTALSLFSSMGSSAQHGVYHYRLRYDRPLSAAEVQSIYEALQAGLPGLTF